MRETERPPRSGLPENPIRCNLAGQPGHSERPVQAPRVKFAFSCAAPAAISSAASETLKASISPSLFSSPIVMFVMKLVLLFIEGLSRVVYWLHVLTATHTYI